MARPAFDPVDTTFNPASHSFRDAVESPSLTSGNALARFEFARGRSSKDATKVLMVEWEEDASTLEIQGDWEVSWEKKRTVLPAKEVNTDSEEGGGGGGGGGAGGEIHRLYFLLGPGLPVPTKVQLQKGAGERRVTWCTSPLPAIFPPELGAKAGAKGVLHTIWAKKRLQVLSREISLEAGTNAEGVGLEMALAEREWIEAEFGVKAKPERLDIAATTTTAAAGLNSPTSPRSPGGGRLMEKLKGLRLGTTREELDGSASSSSGLRHTDDTHDAVLQHNNPLSPESSDVAVGSFAALKGPSSTISSQPSVPPPARKITAQRPPASFVQQQQQQQGGGMASLNAFASGDLLQKAKREEEGEEEDDDLFALPMSPRSPEMAKSPFSFAKADTSRYLRGEEVG